MVKRVIAGAVLAFGLAYAVAWALPDVEPAEIQSCVIMAQWC